MPATIADADTSAVSWPAILVGATAAAALTLVLMAFGSTVGLASVSPWTNSGISATTFKWTAGLYLVVVAMLSSTVGGYMAGRLRTKWTGAHSEEVLFRDTAHGFMAWALATVIGVAILGTATTALLGGAAVGAGAAGAQQASQAAASPMRYFADSLLRAPATPSADRTADAAPREEVAAILTRGLANPDGVPAADRTYLVQLVAARTGLNPTEAETRVGEVINQAKAAVDEARKFSAALALWLTLAMFCGAFSASAAAIEGGQLRDGRWRGIIGGSKYRSTATN